jgi:hypothetical protein
MRNNLRVAATAALIPFFLTACINSGGKSGGTLGETSSVMVSQIVAICGAAVGGQAEQRINQEWNKYPGAQANRQVIESMADVLLTNSAGNQVGTAEYSKYMSCATGLLLANGAIQ